MKSAGKARSNGLYRHIRTSKEIIRNLLNYYYKLLHRAVENTARCFCICEGEMCGCRGVARADMESAPTL